MRQKWIFVGLVVIMIIGVGWCTFASHPNSLDRFTVFTGSLPLHGKNFKTIGGVDTAEECAHTAIDHSAQAFGWEKSGNCHLYSGGGATCPQTNNRGNGIVSGCRR